MSKTILNQSSRMLTWGELLKIVSSMTEEQLMQPVQAVDETLGEWVATGRPVSHVASVSELGIEAFRSVRDNEWHGTDMVLCVTGNPFSRNGAIGYSFNDEDGTMSIPVYGDLGKTDPSKQWAPRKGADYPAFSSFVREEDVE